MEDPYYWWNVYGRFSPGEDNLPCLGEVLAYYFALSGLPKSELAHLLGWTQRYIEMLISLSNKDMPQLLPRRILLAKVLHIPPVLLGLSSVTLMEWGNGMHASAQGTEPDTLASKESVSFYERLLAMSWELYYTSTVQKAAGSIEASFHMLDKDSENATTVENDQYDALRCRFYQLYSLVLRDRMENDAALDYENKAIAIAYRLKNAELIAAALLRRARIYIRQQNYALALKDALDMLPYADLSRDPLKGKCYQMAGEAQGYLAGDRIDLQEKSLNYFKKAAQIARKGNLTPDGSFVKTDITSISIERAEALTLFGRFEEAHSTLAIARKNLSPELTRWEVNLLLAEAHTYFAQGDITSCCYSLQDALKIARAIHLPSKEERISALCQRCQQQDAQNVTVQQLKKLLDTKAS